MSSYIDGVINFKMKRFPKPCNYISEKANTPYFHGCKGQTVLFFNKNNTILQDN